MTSRTAREARVLRLLSEYRDGGVIRYNGHVTSTVPWEKLDNSLNYLSGIVEGYKVKDDGEAEINKQIADLNIKIKEYWENKR